MKKTAIYISTLLILNGITSIAHADITGKRQVEKLSNVSSAFGAAMDSQSCKKIRGKLEPFILVLKKGENINDAIVQCANDAQIPSASFSALGAVEVATLRYFDHNKKKYIDKQFGENLEIISMPGNITKLDGKYFTHIHAALADLNYHVIGGHVKAATVGATAEIAIIPMKEKLFRTMNEEVGLNIIHTKNNG